MVAGSSRVVAFEITPLFSTRGCPATLLAVDYPEWEAAGIPLEATA